MREYFIEPPAFGRKDEDSKPSAFEVAKQQKGKIKLKVIKKDRENAASIAEPPVPEESSARQSDQGWAAELKKHVEGKAAESGASTHRAREQAGKLWKEDKAA